MKLIRVLSVTLLVSAAWAAEPTVETAFERINSFDFVESRKIAAQYVALHGDDPLGHAVAAAVDLFSELERLQLLSPAIVAGKSAIPPDRQVWLRVQSASARAQQNAGRLLAQHPNDPRALLALMLVHGLERDYLALVDKSYRQSWVSARLAQEYALQLTRAHPALQDAWFTIGFNDYLVSSAPFFVRPFMRMEGARGDRSSAIANLEKAAAGGRYLKGLAQIMLARIYRQEKRPRESDLMLQRLFADYPDNPLAIPVRSGSRQSE